MSMMTITEALAEIKTLGKRITAKRQFIGQYLARQEALKDPLVNEGGSPETLKRERQAISDLETRIVKIRTTIQSSNLMSMLTVGNSTRTVAEWLTWRKEIAPGTQGFLRQLSSSIEGARKQALAKGISVVTVAANAQAPSDLIVNIDEKQLGADIEALETTLGGLDGQLSLKNATTTITIPD